MYIELKTLLKEDEYNLIKKEMRVDNFIVYPVYLRKHYFLSDKVLGIIKNTNSKIYNDILKAVNKNEVIEIKIV